MTNPIGIQASLGQSTASCADRPRGRLENLVFSVLAGPGKRHKPTPGRARQPFSLVNAGNPGRSRRAARAAERQLAHDAGKLRQALAKTGDGALSDKAHDRLARLAERTARLGDALPLHAAQRPDDGPGLLRFMQDQLLRQYGAGTSAYSLSADAQACRRLAKLKMGFERWAASTPAGGTQASAEHVATARQALGTAIDAEAALRATGKDLDFLAQALSAGSPAAITPEAVAAFERILTARRMLRPDGDLQAFLMPKLRLLSREPDGAAALSRAVLAFSSDETMQAWKSAVAEWAKCRAGGRSDATESTVAAALNDLKDIPGGFRSAAIEVLKEAACEHSARLAAPSLQPTADGLQILYGSVAALQPHARKDKLDQIMKALFAHAVRNALVPPHQRDFDGIHRLAAPLTEALAQVTQKVDGHLVMLNAPQILDPKELDALRAQMLGVVLDGMGVQRALDAVPGSAWLATQMAQQEAAREVLPGKPAPEIVRSPGPAMNAVHNGIKGLLDAFLDRSDRNAEKAVGRKLPRILQAWADLQRFDNAQRRQTEAIDEALKGLVKFDLVYNGPLGNHFGPDGLARGLKGRGKADLLRHIPADQREQAQEVLAALWQRVHVAQAKATGLDSINAILREASPLIGASSPAARPGARSLEKIHAATQSLAVTTTWVFQRSYLPRDEALELLWSSLEDGALAMLLNVFSPYAAMGGQRPLREELDAIAMAAPGGAPDRTSLHDAMFRTLSQEALARLRRRALARAPAFRAQAEPEIQRLYAAVASPASRRRNGLAAADVVSRLIDHARDTSTPVDPPFIFTGTHYETAGALTTHLRRRFDALWRDLYGDFQHLNVAVCGHSGARVDMDAMLTNLQETVLNHSGILQRMHRQDGKVAPVRPAHGRPADAALPATPDAAAGATPQAASGWRSRTGSIPADPETRTDPSPYAVSEISVSRASGRTPKHAEYDYPPDVGHVPAMRQVYPPAAAGSLGVPPNAQDIADWLQPYLPENTAVYAVPPDTQDAGYASDEGTGDALQS
ncbi:hypothetical protein CAL14_09895 [Bordetella genomosp. 9]|nr:hypothetical protein CAL14_09895 [Bordetella genomosp. 9]